MVVQLGLSSFTDMSAIWLTAEHISTIMGMGMSQIHQINYSGLEYNKMKWMAIKYAR